MMDKLPFKVVKGGGTTLVRQIVDGFRRSIDFGFYRPGDMLPSLREVSKETGVSLIVVREAFQRLSAEGFVSPRRGIGSIVTDRQAYAWRGHIVIASVEIRENHLISAMTGALLALLESGIDIPSDVKLVTWSNAGEGPFWRKSLTRIEVDPIESGRVFADYVLAYLTGKKIKQRVVISPKYIIGDTFPAS